MQRLSAHPWAKRLIGAATVVALAIAAVAVLHREEKPPPAPRTWPDALFAAEKRKPRIIDLCDDETAVAVLNKDALDEHRAKLGIDCRKSDAIRYAGVTPLPGHRDPLYRPSQLEWAREWLHKEAKRIAASAPFRPTAADFFDTKEPDANGCVSRGLKKIPIQGRNRAEVKADLDADGRTDRLAYYELWDRLGDLEPHVRIGLGTGTIIDYTDDGFDPINSLFSPADFDQDGRQELWIEVNSNKPGLMKLFLFEDCELKEVTERHDSWFGIHTYDRIGEHTTAECTDTRITVLSYTRHVDEPYGEHTKNLEESWFFRVLRLEGRELVEVERGSGDDLDTRPSRFHWESGFLCSKFVDAAR